MKTMASAKCLNTMHMRRLQLVKLEKKVYFLPGNQILIPNWTTLLDNTQRYKLSCSVLIMLFLCLHDFPPMANSESDNSSEFTNAKMKELEDLNIKHITSLPYKPSSNGQVEHFNKGQVQDIFAWTKWLLSFFI